MKLTSTKKDEALIHIIFDPNDNTFSVEMLIKDDGGKQPTELKRLLRVIAQAVDENYTTSRNVPTDFSNN